MLDFPCSITMSYINSAIKGALQHQHTKWLQWDENTPSFFGSVDAQNMVTLHLQHVRVQQNRITMLCTYSKPRRMCYTKADISK